MGAAGVVVVRPIRQPGGVLPGSTSEDILPLVSVPIRSSEDILIALRGHPEWKEAVRREILTGELLELPAKVAAAERERAEDSRQIWEAIRRLAASQERTEATLRSFMASTEAFQRSMEEFRTSMQGFRTSMEEFRTSMQGFRTSMEEFRTSMEEFKEATEKRFRGIELELDFFVGKSIEFDVGRKLGNYLRAKVRKLRRLDPDMVDALIDTALESGRLTESEGEDLGNADALVAGKDLESGAAACVAVEVSKTVDRNDVERAARRAKLFLKASTAAAHLPERFQLFSEPPGKAYGLAVGRRITGEARRAAERSGVLFGLYKNGHDREAR